MQLYSIYDHIFEDGRGKTLPALLEIAARHIAKTSPNSIPPAIAKSISQPFEAPKMKESMVGFNGYLSTLADGLANELFDFEKAKEFSKTNEIVLAKAPNELVKNVGSQGSLLAYCNVVAGSYDECLERFMEIGKQLVLKGAPWEV